VDVACVDGGGSQARPGHPGVAWRDDHLSPEVTAQERPRERVLAASCADDQDLLR
jgi:hypothetical protein